MRNIIIAASVVFTVLLNGCNPQVDNDNKLEQAKQFMGYLEKNDTASIYKICYVTHPREKDIFLQTFDLAKAHEFIKKHGVPKEEKWIVKSNPNEQFDRTKVIIPIFSGVDTTYPIDLLRADFIICFPPPEISKKIYRFELNDEYAMEQLKTIGQKN